MASRNIKAGDKAQICRKLVASLHKLYGKSSVRVDYPVLETMLFAVCLEDNDWAAAEIGYQKLFSDFFDLNEVRVSSVAELELILAPLRLAEWKGLRLKSILRHVFESSYSFEFEKLRRLNADSAVRALKKIDDMTPFVRDFTLCHALGNHVVYLDTSMLNAAVWLGLVPAGSDIDAASEILKPAIRKTDVPEFCLALRQLAVDPKHVTRLAEPPDVELSILDVPERLVELQSPPRRKKKSPPAPEPKSAADSPPAKGSGKKASSGKTETSPPARKTAARKPAPRKPVAKKK